MPMDQSEYSVPFGQEASESTVSNVVAGVSEYTLD